MNNKPKQKAPVMNVYPYDDAIEEAVLGALMIESQAMLRVASRIEPGMFYRDEHQVICQAICQLYDAGRAIDMIVVSNKLMEMGGLPGVEAVHFYVASLTSKVVSSAHLEEHVAILDELSIRRKAIALLSTQLCRMQELTWDVHQVLDETLETLSNLAAAQAPDTLRDLPTLMRDTLQQAQWRMANNKEGITGIPTGLEALDRLTAGWQPTELTVIGARPATGKTSLTVYMAWAAAQAGYKVVYYSLEMAAERLADKWVIAETNISADNWRRGTVTPEEDEAVAAAVGRLTSPEIRVDDCSAMSMEQIRSRSRMLQQKGWCDIIFIDYLQLGQITGSKANHTMATDMGEMAARAKAMAKSLKVPVILISQLNREAEKRQDKRPQMADLRDSGGIEQVADIVALLYNPSKAGQKTETRSGYPSEGLGVLMVEKNRNGATEDIYFGYNPSMTRFGRYEPPMDWMQKHARPMTAKEVREAVS